MTRITTLSVLTATALLVGAVAARAADVTVQVDGRSPTQLHSELVSAANKVCANAIHQDIFDDYESQDQCVTDTVHATMKKIAATNDAGYRVAQTEVTPAR